MIKTIPAYRPIPSASDSPDSSPEKKAEHHRLSSQGGGPSHHHPHRPPNPHNLQHRQLQQRERHELQQRRETGIQTGFTVAIDEILSVKNARAWVSMVSYLKR